MILVQSDPQFIVTKSICLKTKDQELSFDEGDPIGFLKTNQDKLFLGNPKKGTQLELGVSAVAKQLLEYCMPCNFELSLNEEGDSYMKPVLFEEKVTITEKISRIPVTESIPNNPSLVLKIEQK